MATLSPRSGIGSEAAAPARSHGWAVVAVRECRDIWLSARGPLIVFVFSLLLSLLTYLAASNKELNILDQRATVNLVVQITVAMGITVALLFSADAISGERERETLESLLLTPVPRRQLGLGKLLAAASVWPALLVVAVPYVWVLKGSAGLLVDAILSAILIGTLLTIAFSSLGFIISVFSNSNRLSLSASFFLFVVLVAPTQLPLSGWFGDAILRANPVTAGSSFMDEVVKGRAWDSQLSLLVAPVVAAVVVSSIAGFVGGRIRLEGGLDR
jgi:ABC-2 type transport system permease protein